MFVADLFGDIPEEEKAKLGGLPGSLGDALKALEADHEYLTRGGVFPERLLQVFIRRCRKADEAVARPPPRRVCNVLRPVI